MKDTQGRPSQGSGPNINHKPHEVTGGKPPGYPKAQATPVIDAPPMSLPDIIDDLFELHRDMCNVWFDVAKRDIGAVDIEEVAQMLRICRALDAQFPLLDPTPLLPTMLEIFIEVVRVGDAWIPNAEDAGLILRLAAEFGVEAQVHNAIHAALCDQCAARIVRGH